MFSSKNFHHTKEADLRKAAKQTKWKMLLKVTNVANDSKYLLLEVQKWA